MTVIAIVLSVVNIVLFGVIFALREKIRKLDETIARHDKDLTTLIVHTQALTDAVNQISKALNEAQDIQMEDLVNWYMKPKTQA